MRATESSAAVDSSSARSFSRPPPPQEGEGPFRQGISHKQPELGLRSPNVCANICSVLLHGIKFGPRTTLDVVDLIQLHSMPLLVPQPNLVFHIGGDQGLVRVAYPQTGMRVHPKEAQYQVPCPHHHFDHMLRETEMAKRMEEMML